MNAAIIFILRVMMEKKGFKVKILAEKKFKANKINYLSLNFNILKATKINL